VILILPIMGISLIIGLFWKRMTVVSWMLLIVVIVATIGYYAIRH